VRFTREEPTPLIACVGERPLSSYGNAVELGAFLQSETTPLGGDWVVETVKVAGVAVSVTTDDPKVRQQIIDSISSRDASHDGFGDSCGAIAQARSILFETDPWEGHVQLTEGADAIVLAKVAETRPAAGLPQDRLVADAPGEQTRTVFEARLEIGEIVKADGKFEAGDIVTVLNGSVLGPIDDQPCLILSANDTVLVGLIWNEYTNRYVLFNVDSVFYVSGGGDVLDTGRTYGGIDLLERMRAEELQAILKPGLTR